MSTSVFQGLQSCLEPGLIEPLVLRLKLALPVSKPSNKNKPPQNENQDQDHGENDNADEFVTKKKIKKGTEESGLSFLQALTAKNDTETEHVYVHPMVKRSASMLSSKSLEMCTESLGSETGSDTGGDNSSGDEMSLLSPSQSPQVTATAETTTKQSTRALEVARHYSPKRLYRVGSFPPPLTSVSGSASFKVRPHREDGRLVLKAVAVAASTAFFHAERADGRLTLRLMTGFPEKNDEEEEEEQEEEEEEEQEEGEEEEEEQEVERVTQHEEEGEEGNGGEEETEEVKIGAETIQRPSRCKEDGQGNNNVMMNWEPYLVAT